MTDDSNPFNSSLIAQGRRFADREQEVSRIRDAYRTPGSRLIVVGERRMGKTSALYRAADFERKRGAFLAIASFATATDPADAARQILLGVKGELGRNWRAALEGMVGRLQGGIEIRPSPIPGVPPSLHITFGLREESRADLIPATLTAIHDQLANSKRHLALALDEFQRIYEWGGEDAEWALKAEIERHPAISYVLAGSQRGLIEAMVSRKGRALWKQADVLAMGPIAPQEMAEWIHQEATRTGASFQLEACDAIVAAAGPRTRDIVQLAREAWFEHARRSSELDVAGVQRRMDSLVQEQATLYSGIWRNRNATEQKILRTLVSQPNIALTSADALERYRLGPKSTVQGTIRRLVDSEFLADTTVDGLAFDDPFFRRWIETTVLPAIGISPAEH